MLYLSLKLKVHQENNGLCPVNDRAIKGPSSSLSVSSFSPIIC
jgi:hypothetical protein